VGISFDTEAAVPKINRILPDMGAEKAGLQAGDIIIAVNKTDVTNREQVIELVREFREGQTINLAIRRDDESFDVDITLMKPPANMLASFDPGYSTVGRQYRRLSGRVSQRAQGFSQVIEHDTVLQPFLCGGPLVNLDGKAIGLNIARASRFSTYALPADLVQQIFQKLKAEQVH
jgi:serine protease Do